MSNDDADKTLEEFRQNWKKEIKDRHNLNRNDVSEELNTENESQLKLATELFIQGSQLENKGKVYEALRLYRKACQLVPDIEFRIYEMQKKSSKNKPEQSGQDNPSSSTSKASNPYDKPVPIDQEEEENLKDLEEHFRKSLSDCNYICERNSSPDTITTGVHFSDLPLEIIMYILKWLVSNDLDLKSLELFGKVCKGFFLCSRDQEIWRIACTKIWGINCGSPNEMFPTYREMFINRARVNFNGVYISKITYLRLGENSFQDQFYRPVQLVEYYRYIRFLPNGKLVMFTSADDIQVSVNRLKNLQNFLQQKDVLVGNYKLQDDNVIIVVNKNQNQVFQKQKKKRESEDFYSRLTFFVELQIHRKKRKLTWSSYSAMQIKNGQEQLSEFELIQSKYPPFFFSQVKGFHAQSNEILKL